MIRRWLRNWLGIQALDDQLNPQPKFVSREGNRIEPASVVTPISVSAPAPESEPPIKKGYDNAPIR